MLQKNHPHAKCQNQYNLLLKKFAKPLPPLAARKCGLVSALTSAKTAVTKESTVRLVSASCTRLLQELVSFITSNNLSIGREVASSSQPFTWMLGQQTRAAHSPWGVWKTQPKIRARYYQWCLPSQLKGWGPWSLIVDPKCWNMAIQFTTLMCRVYSDARRDLRPLAGSVSDL